MFFQGVAHWTWGLHFSAYIVEQRQRYLVEREPRREEDERGGGEVRGGVVALDIGALRFVL